MDVLQRFSLAGKVAVVTGGTGLYGRPFAEALGQAGATVVVTSRSASAAETTARQLDMGPGSAIGIELDQGVPDSIMRFGAKLIDHCGHVDVLVNNAVHRQGRGIDDTSAADWDATSAVNSRGLFLLTQLITQRMREQGSGGSVINIGSIYGIVGPDFAIYDGTTMTSPAFYSYDKAGMIGFTRYLASALGPDGIRVNCLCPGGLRSGDQDKTFVAAYESRTPLRRLAVADDVTPSLIYLASDASRYVTGVTLPVDGGWTAH